MTLPILILRIIAELGAIAGPVMVGMWGRLAKRPPIDSAPPPATAPRGRLALGANICALAVFFSSLWWPFHFRNLPAWGPIAMGILGIAVVAGGALMMLAARGALGAAWSLVPKASQQSGLATTGLYAHVRHPIYLAMTIAFLGCAVAFANWLSILLLLLLVLPTLLWRATLEEQLLVQTFGDQYIIYRRQTKRIIPFIV